jgi:hypothetical protein
MTDDEKYRVFADNRPKTMVLDNVAGDALYCPGAAMARFPVTTLTERVVGFLERYNKSIYSLG